MHFAKFTPHGMGSKPYIKKGEIEMEREKEHKMKKKQNEKGKSNKNKKHSFGLKQKWIISVGTVLLVACIIVSIMLFQRKEDPAILTTTTLQEIVNVQELSTYEVIYNGIAEVKSDKKAGEIAYYVSYEAVVKLGIDFGKITIEQDEDLKKIIITIPDLGETEEWVDIASLDYIWIDKTANTETVVEKAYKACIADVKQEIATEKTIFELAKQNAINIVEALVRPFVEQIDAEYSIVVK